MKNVINLTIILTGGILLILGCSAPKDSNQPAQPASNQTAAKPAETKKNEVAKVETPVIKWSDYNNVFSIKSKTTDLQKEAAWKDYKGKSVTWTGEVNDVSKGVMGGLSLNVKMNPDTLTFDVSVNLKKEEEAKASKLVKGNKVTFSGTLSSYGGAILPSSLDDGEIK